jgi:hypothetical protein
MHCRDREAFAQAFLVFAQASQLDIPPGSAELYWIVLQQYPWELVERGLQRAMRRRRSTFPPPSALAELIEEVIAQLAERRWMQAERRWMQAERRWMQLLEAAREVGPHHSLVSDDPAWAEALRIMFVDWPTTCRRLREAEGAERTMLHKDFVQAYRLAWDRDLSRAQGYLKGLREIWQALGQPVELLPVMQIGEADRPEPLPILGGSPATCQPPEATVESAERMPAEHTQALLADLVTHLSMPAVFPRRSQRRLPPARGAEALANAGPATGHPCIKWVHFIRRRCDRQIFLGTNVCYDKRRQVYAV